MSRRGRSWLFAAVGAAGCGLTLVHSLLGVGVSFVALVAATFSMTDLNVISTRTAQRTAALFNGIAVYLATGSALLGLSVVPMIVFALPGTTALSRSRSVVDFEPLAGLVAGLALAALGWPSSGYVGLLHVVPNVLLGVLMVAAALMGRRMALSRVAQVQLRVGDPMPNIALPFRGIDGRFDLSQEGGRFHLFVFVRGDWCPVCHVMMRVISKQRDVLSRHNVRLFIVTPSDGAVDEEFAGCLGLDSPMLYDEGAATAKRLGLVEGRQREGREVPLPVALLVGPDGVLRDITLPDDVSAFSSEPKIVKALAGAMPAAAPAV